ncbi:hypothetical protein Vafri_2409 [Volvox africanus]|nr:hypothetical protein Vafri_2409 [Volvox africanus]
MSFFPSHLLANSLPGPFPPSNMNAARLRSSLLERLVGARLVWRQAAMNRIISFEYLNRQLVWQELSEALLLLMPLVDIARLRRAAMRALPRPETAAAATAAASTASVSMLTAAAATGPCPLCSSDDPLTAVVALPCRHIYCYYCLRSQTEADTGFRCPLDGVRVAAMRRVTGKLATGRGPGQGPQGSVEGGKGSRN